MLYCVDGADIDREAVACVYQTFSGIICDITFIMLGVERAIWSQKINFQLLGQRTSETTQWKARAIICLINNWTSLTSLAHLKSCKVTNSRKAP